MIGTRTFRLSPEDLRPRAEALRAAGGRLQFAYAWFPANEAPEVRYLSSIPGQQDFDMWVVTGRRELPSLAGIFPLIGWYEREMMDLQGLTFAGHPEPYPLVLRDGATRINGNGFANGRAHLPRVDAADVQQLPFGPIRADVVEIGGIHLSLRRGAHHPLSAAALFQAPRDGELLRRRGS